MAPQATYVSQPAVETIVQPAVVQETIVEDLVIDVPLERPTVSGGIDALGLKPTQLNPIDPTYVTPVNETIVEAPRIIEAPRTVQYMSAPTTYGTAMPLTSTLNRSFNTVPMTMGSMAARPMTMGSMAGGAYFR